MRAMRGQATTELALSSLVLVSIASFGIYFGEVTFGALKVQEAANSATMDLTDYPTHKMLSLLYDTGPIGTAVTSTQTNTFNDYQDFDGRTSPAAIKSTNVQHVFTNTKGMRVNCSRGGAPGYLANPLLIAAYFDNSGASCTTAADFLTVNMPSHFADNHGFFKVPHWGRTTLTMCGTGTASAGACKGKNSIMLDDWGLMGKSESNPAPGLPYGIPSLTNLSYWTTTYKAYLTSYYIIGAFNLRCLLCRRSSWRMPPTSSSTRWAVPSRSASVGSLEREHVLHELR